MNFFAIIISILLIGIDQLTKYAAVVYLEPIGSFPLINNVFELAFVKNEGAAFGILQGGRWFFVVTTPFILAGIIYYYYKLPKGRPYNWLRYALILIFSGAFGNFIDRARQGYVVDFFYARVINFPVFNMADTYVVTGTVLYVVLAIFFIKDENNDKNKRSQLPMS